MKRKAEWESNPYSSNSKGIWALPRLKTTCLPAKSLREGTNTFSFLSIASSSCSVKMWESCQHKRNGIWISDTPIKPSIDKTKTVPLCCSISAWNRAYCEPALSPLLAATGELGFPLREQNKTKQWKARSQETKNICWNVENVNITHFLFLSLLLSLSLVPR